MTDLQIEADRILALTDDQVIAEASAQGIDPEEAEADLRAMIKNAIERELKPRRQ